MSNYKIKVNIEIVESDTPPHSEPNALEDGSFELNISAAQAESIDECEQALMRANSPALRAALGRHLAQMSKKNLKS
jgi:hypothetical protein